jgi:hypothetical protein
MKAAATKAIKRMLGSSLQVVQMIFHFTNVFGTPHRPMRAVTHVNALPYASETRPGALLR